MRRALVTALLVLSPAIAQARSEKTEPFTAGEAFPVAIRFLRIDAGVKIVEKDADSGYVLFDLDEDHHTFRGALELVKTDVGGRESVKLVLRIDDRPEWEEQVLLDHLEAKLRQELRPTAEHRPAPAPPKDGDGSGSGTGSGSGSGSGSGATSGSGS